jgi:hypothetical protein
MLPFALHHSSKNLKKQFEEITYFLKKADKIIRDLGRNFSWREFDTLYYNRKTTTQQKYQSQSINVISKIEDYAKKLFEEDLLKTSKSKMGKETCKASEFYF